MSDFLVGWYHSHPGYGCWLSARDFVIQNYIQEEMEQSLAIVIDSMRTVSIGKVEIGAFRTYPEEYEPRDEPVFEHKTIPLGRIEEYSFCRKHVARKQSLSFFFLLGP